MKTFLLFLTIIFLIFSCKDQNKSPNTIHTSQSKGQNPKEDVQVNKTFDKKGNLVKFDSTYTYSYTSNGLDSSRVMLDTVLQHFKSFYDSDFSERWNKEFEKVFLSDSLFKYDFPNEDYFSKRFELNTEHMKKMMLQMDSMKTNILKKPLPSSKY
jgi:hypothetical protein